MIWDTWMKCPHCKKEFLCKQENIYSEIQRQETTSEYVFFLEVDCPECSSHFDYTAIFVRDKEECIEETPDGTNKVYRSEKTDYLWKEE